MAVPAKRARELALSLDNASSYPHFDRTAFRTPRRTFATLALNGSDVNFMFDLVQQAHFCALAPHAIAPVSGGWGRMGATRCDLKLIDAKTFALALRAAHARANAPLAKKAAKAPKTTNSTKTAPGPSAKRPNVEGRIAKRSGAKPASAKPASAKRRTAKRPRDAS